MGHPTAPPRRIPQSQGLLWLNRRRKRLLPHQLRQLHCSRRHGRFQRVQRHTGRNEGGYACLCVAVFALVEVLVLRVRRNEESNRIECRSKAEVSYMDKYGKAEVN